ncbi:MAG: type II secretion system GspH family protein [Planctomycetota bacterium]|nr:type II secretion system GspH family protein [Planctomycetota bacterium]
MKRGFTLIELLLVLAILGALVGILLPTVVGWAGAGKLEQIKTNVGTLRTAIEQYALEKGVLPRDGSVTELEADLRSVANPLLPRLPDDPYASSNDPWTKLEYKKDTNGRYYVVGSDARGNKDISYSIDTNGTLTVTRPDTSVTEGADFYFDGNYKSYTVVTP